MKASNDTMRAIEERSGIIKGINFIKRKEQEKRDQLKKPIPITFVRDEYEFLNSDSKKINRCCQLFSLFLIATSLIISFY